MSGPETTGHDQVDDDQGIEEPWQLLHPLTWVAGVAITGAIMLGIGIVTAVILVVAGISLAWTLLWVVLGVVVLTGLIGVAEIIRVRATRYRIHRDRLQLRIQFIASSTRSLPLSRIRTIDLTADLVQRLFGLTSVRFGTGDQSGAKFALSTLSQTDAEALRRTILGTAPAAADDDRPTTGVGRLASFELGWIRYAPVSLAVPALGVAAFGAVVQVADWFNMVPQLWGLISGLMVSLILPLQILVLLLIALVIGVIGSMIIFVEAWWNYHLDRDADGTLHIQRGLFVRRSSSFSGSRIRGITLEEPLGYRRAGAAKLKIIAVGLQQQDSNQNQQMDASTIVPAVPRAVAVGVAETVIGRTLPTDDLVGHPRAAALRRYRWAGFALFAVLVLLALPALLWQPVLWSLVAAVAVVGIPITWWLARDNARSLGHLITEAHVVIRTGSVFRSTHVLTRNGLLGWNLRQSPGQRRLGLVTLVATSAANPGHFRLPDLDPAAALPIQRTAGTVWDHLWTTSAPSLARQRPAR